MASCYQRVRVSPRKLWPRGVQLFKTSKQYLYSNEKKAHKKKNKIEIINRLLIKLNAGGNYL